MSRRKRIDRPFNVRDPDLAFWMEQVTDAINHLPGFSISSTTDGPESQVTADSGTLLIDVGSSAMTFWLKLSGSSNVGWGAADWV